VNLGYDLREFCLTPSAERKRKRRVLIQKLDNYLAATFAWSAAAETPLSPAPVSPDDIQQITRVIGAVTDKPILMIAGVLEDSYVPGAVTGNAYELNTNTGKRTPQYIRTDLVSVYMPYIDRSHVEVYIVRKVRGRWKIEEKKDWFL
jgi:hypothetical protein